VTLGGIGFTVSLFITGKIWATSPYFSAPFAKRDRGTSTDPSTGFAAVAGREEECV